MAAILFLLVECDDHDAVSKDSKVVGMYFNTYLHIESFQNHLKMVLKRFNTALLKVRTRTESRKFKGGVSCGGHFVPVS